MRYRNPSIPDAIRKLRDEGIREVLLIPLFPHYAMSSFETAVERVREVMAAIAPEHFAHGRAALLRSSRLHPGHDGQCVGVFEAGLRPLAFQFSRHPREAFAQSPIPPAAIAWRSRIAAGGQSRSWPPAIARNVSKRWKPLCGTASIPKDKHSIAFQSRLGREPWLKPYTDWVIPGLARGGIRKLLVICPSFVSDCLETLEEIGMRGREIFLESGGREFHLIPCLNEHPLWLAFLEGLIGGFVAKGHCSGAPISEQKSAKKGTTRPTH